MSEKNEIAVLQKEQTFITLGDRYELTPGAFLSTMINTVGIGLKTAPEIAAFGLICNQYKLNPLIKEIYVFKNPQTGVLAPIIGCDGWYSIMNKHPEYDGHELDIEWIGEGEKRKVFAITCKMYRKDRKYPTEHTEYYRACYKDTKPWNSHPERMLEEKAISQTVRIAFSISGVYDEDEAKDVTQGIEYREPPNILDKHEAETDNAGGGDMVILEQVKPAKVQTSKAKRKQSSKVNKPKVDEIAPPPVEELKGGSGYVETHVSGTKWTEEKSDIGSEGVPVNNDFVKETRIIAEQRHNEAKADDICDMKETDDGVSRLLPENDKLYPEGEEPTAEMPNHEKPLIKPKKLTSIMELIMTVADQEHPLVMTFNDAIKKQAKRKNCKLQEAYKQLLEKFDVLDLAALNEDRFSELET